MIGIDSDFIIELLKGNNKALEKAQATQEPIFTTTINFFEVMRSVMRHSKKREIALEFFNEIQILDLDYAASLKSAEIASKLDQSGKFAGSGDVLIAGILLSNGIEKIISNNKDHFETCGMSVVSY